MERVKTISRNKAGLAEAESYRPELLTDEEPRYLRRQRPVEIRRKKFAGRGWSFYRKVAILGVAGIASVTDTASSATRSTEVTGSGWNFSMPISL